MIRSENNKELTYKIEKNHIERTAKTQGDMKQEEKGKKIKAVYEFQQPNNGISRKEKTEGKKSK